MMPHSIPILHTVEDVRKWRNTLSDSASLGFVPTMGALHEGHLQLVRHSLSSQKHTIVSIFVNPAQFGPTEDLSSYPSTLETDLEKLTSLKVLPGTYQIPHDGFDGKIKTTATTTGDGPMGDEQFRTVSAVFLPTNHVLYPSGIVTDVDSQRGAFVTVHGLSEQLEGARRPGFFRGVATVVLKLFMIVEPSVAFFGQKDLQQCLLVRQMCKDLHIVRPRSIIAIPTVREPTTGLAMSSRNAYLLPNDADAAKVLHTFLLGCAERLMNCGCNPSNEELLRNFNPTTTAISLDFLSVNDPVTFNPIPQGQKMLPDLPIAISGAILVTCSTGRVVRLLDNVVINHDLNHPI